MAYAYCLPRRIAPSLKIPAFCCQHIGKTNKSLSQIRWGAYRPKGERMQTHSGISWYPVENTHLTTAERNAIVCPMAVTGSSSHEGTGAERRRMVRAFPGSLAKSPPSRGLNASGRGSVGAAGRSRNRARPCRRPKEEIRVVPRREHFFAPCFAGTGRFVF